MSVEIQVSQDTVVPVLDTPCMQKLTRKREWHAVLAVRVGQLVVGVRCDTPETTDRLESLLRPLRAPGLDSVAEPNYSVELGSPLSRGRRGLALVHHDHELVARRRDPEALCTDLVELLDETARLFTTDSLLLAAGAVLTRDGRVCLVPARVHGTLLTRRGQLEAAGLRLGSSRALRVDVESGTVRTGCVDPAVAELRAELEDEMLPDATLPIAVWCTPAVGTEPFVLRPGQGVIAAFNMVTNRNLLGTRRTLSDLRSAVLAHRFVGMPELPSVAQTSAVVGLLR